MPMNICQRHTNTTVHNTASLRFIYGHFGIFAMLVYSLLNFFVTLRIILAHTRALFNTNF